MYNCYLHGWSSHHEMCPQCITYRTSSGTITVDETFYETTEFGDFPAGKKRTQASCNKCDLVLRENAELKRELDAIKAGSPKPRKKDWK